MSDAARDQLLSALLPALALLSLTVLLVRGKLRPSSLDGAPPREVGFDHWTARVMVLAYLAMLLALAAQAWTGPPAATQPATAPSGSPADIAAQNLAGQVLAQAPIALFALFLAGRRENGLERLGIVPRRLTSHARAGLLALAAALPLVLMATMLGEWVARRLGRPSPDWGHSLLGVLAESEGLARATLLASAVVVAPVLEEIIFRGLVQTTLLELLGRRRRWLVVFAAGAVFAVIHGSVWPFALPALFVLSLFLGWLYERTGSLWPGIVAHAGFNAFNAAWVIAAGNGR